MSSMQPFRRRPILGASESARSRRIFALLLLLLTAGRSLFAAELLVADRAGNRIVALDEATGKFLRVVASTGFDGPSSLTFGPGGLLYVANNAGGPYPGSTAASVVRVDPAATNGTTTSFINTVIAPSGVAFHAATNSFFVSEFGNFDGSRVFRFTATGTANDPPTVIGTGSPATARGGITFDAAGNLYVSETNFNGAGGSVLKYDATNNYAPLGTFATGVGLPLVIPMVPASGFNGLAFSQGTSGDLYVASLVGQAVVKFSVTAGSVTGSGQFGGPIAYPSGIVIEPDGNILATSLGNNNPSDPFYGSSLFPGAVVRYHAATSAATPLLVGDVNHDASVTGADLAGLLAGFGLNSQTDLNGDFLTDGADVLAWQNGLGNQGVQGAFQPTSLVRYVPSGPSLGVPEPATSLLATLAGLTAVAWCRLHSPRFQMATC